MPVRDSLRTGFPVPRLPLLLFECAFALSADSIHTDTSLGVGLRTVRVMIVWTLAALSMGLGLWSDSGDRRRPQRRRGSASLLTRVFYANSTYPKDPVQRQLLLLLGSLSRDYGEKIRAVLAEGLKSGLAPQDIATWRLMPDVGYRDARLEPHVFWIARELNRAYKRGLRMRVDYETLGYKKEEEVPLGELRSAARQISQGWSQIHDWVDATGAQLQNITWQDAVAESTAWHEGGFANEGTFRGPVIPGVPVIVWPDGSRLDRLLTAEQIGQEGASMDHCVGGYWRFVRDNINAIYSFRTPDGVPYMTMSFEIPASKGMLELEEYKGRKNEAIENASALAMVIGMEEFLESQGIILAGDQTASGRDIAVITPEALSGLKKNIDRFDLQPIIKNWRQEWENKDEKIINLSSEVERADSEESALASLKTEHDNLTSEIEGFNEDLLTAKKDLKKALNRREQPDMFEDMDSDDVEDAIWQAKEDLDEAEYEASSAKENLESIEKGIDELEQCDVYEGHADDLRGEIEDLRHELEGLKQGGANTSWALKQLFENIEHITGLSFSTGDVDDPGSWGGDIEDRSETYTVKTSSGNPLIDLQVHNAIDPSTSYIFETGEEHSDHCESATSDNLIDWLIEANLLSTSENTIDKASIQAIGPSWVKGMDAANFLTDNRTFRRKYGDSVAFGRGRPLRARLAVRDKPRLLFDPR